MAFTINTNITSMQAQEYLRTTGDFQAKTINRVTSGLRIINSGDDAAGLAIANTFRSDQAVLSQGIRNANDGLATLQTIDSGISNIGKLLDRARTLAAQSASGTFSGDRNVLQSEFGSVLTEVDRQAKAIGLNLGGDFAKSLTVFVGGGRGANGAAVIANGTATVDLTNSTVDSQSLGLSSYSVTGVTNLDVQSTFTTALNSQTSMAFTISGAGFDDVGVTVNLTGVNDLKGLVTAINEGIATAGAGVTAAATAFKGANISASISSDGKSFSLNSATSAFSVEAGTSAAIDSFLGTNPLSAATKAAGGLQSQEVAFTTLTGVNTQKITISTTDEAGQMQSIDITLGAGSAQVNAQTINTALQSSGLSELKKMFAAEGGVAVAPDKLTIVGKNDFNVTVQAATAAEGITSGVGATATSTSTGATGSVAIGTKSGAEDAVSKLAIAVKNLGQAQAVVGKGQNTFNYAVSLASTQLTNLAASESRIRDADLALEAANLSRAQILQQAGVAALAQANSAPQAVLSLLRG
ncbi:MAG TPA: flagellin [Paludibaculum sp.]